MNSSIVKETATEVKGLVPHRVARKRKNRDHTIV